MAFKVFRSESRRFFFEIDEDEVSFTFGTDFSEQSSSFTVYLDGKQLQLGVTFAINDTSPRIVTLTGSAADHPDDSTLEIVRITRPEGTPTLEELMYMIQEARDIIAFMNGHGPPLERGADIGAPSLFINEFRNIPGGPVLFSQPVIQLLPDGGLVAEPGAANPGGFRSSALRYQHEVTSDVSPRSMSLAWLSQIIRAPKPEYTTTSKHSYYGVKIDLKGYQGEQIDNSTNPPTRLPQSTTALNVVATTASGVQSGKGEGIVSEARHEEWTKAALHWGGGLSALVFTAKTLTGAAGFAIKIKIQGGGGGGGSVQVNGTEITITKDSNSASAVAAQVIASGPASALVTVTAAGNGPVANTGGAFIALRPGTDGKLVCHQGVLVARGADPGRGYYDAVTGRVENSNPDTFDSYGYTANSEGDHAGSAALAIKGMREVGGGQGWHNGIQIDKNVVTDRYFWAADECAILAPTYLWDLQNPNSATGNVRMGIGTDEPESHLHIRTKEVNPQQGTAEAPEARLEMPQRRTENNLPFGRILFDGRGNGASSTPETMVEINANMVDVSDTHEESMLVLKSMLDGNLATRWHFGDGLWANGVTGDNKRGGSINVFAVYVEGVKVLDKASGGAIRLGLGDGETKTISNDEITYGGTLATINAEGSGSADQLTKINGGVKGSWLILLKAADGDNVTVVNNANIICGTNRVLTNNMSMQLICVSPNVWTCPV